MHLLVGNIEGCFQYQNAKIQGPLDPLAHAGSCITVPRRGVLEDVFLQDMCMIVCIINLVILGCFQIIL